MTSPQIILTLLALSFGGSTSEPAETPVLDAAPPAAMAAEAMVGEATVDQVLGDNPRLLDYAARLV